MLRDARPLSHLLLDLHPALLLLLLLDFQLLILLLNLFDGSRGGRSRRPLLRSSRRSNPAAAMAWAALRQPPSCRSLLRTKLVCDIPIAPFPRRTPPVKSSVSVLNKSLIQVSADG